MKEVFPARPSDLLEVAGPDGEFLLPFNREFVAEFDRERRHVIADPPEALLP